MGAYFCRNILTAIITRQAAKTLRSSIVGTAWAQAPPKYPPTKKPTAISAAMRTSTFPAP